ncbi:MAG: aminoglycoside 6-adenylyltransferase [Candidatus Promineifilaceae bacterium]
MTTYNELQTKIIAACQESEAIRAIILVGSRARKDQRIDVHSDLDYILFTPEPESVKTMPEWMETLAPIWVPDYSFTGADDPEWMILYEGGYKVDCTFHKIQPEQTLQEVMTAMPYQGVLSRGFEVLLDKTASKGQINWVYTENNRPSHPTAEQFKQTNDNFLLEAARAARFIERGGDTWRAKWVCDTVHKQKLLTMIEWHTRAKYGLEHDTWYNGRYLSEWADPMVTTALPSTFAAYETADLRRAFQATLALYHRLASETAAALNFNYPTPGQAAALNWLKTLKTNGKS